VQVKTERGQAYTEDDEADRTPGQDRQDRQPDKGGERTRNNVISQQRRNDHQKREQHSHLPIDAEHHPHQRGHTFPSAKLHVKGEDMSDDCHHAGQIRQVRAAGIDRLHGQHSEHPFEHVHQPDNYAVFQPHHGGDIRGARVAGAVVADIHFPHEPADQIGGLDAPESVPDQNADYCLLGHFFSLFYVR